MADWMGQMARHDPKGFGGVFGFSLVVNLLLLVAPAYMLQVYDRVLTSGSLDTLIWITLIAAFLLVVYAIAEVGRRRLSTHVGLRIEAELSARAFRRFESVPESGNALPDDLGGIARVKNLFQQGNILAFFDLPFSPIFSILLFMIHPALGVLGLLGAILVFTLAILAEVTTRRAGARAMSVNLAAQHIALGLARQRSALVAMGLVPGAYEKWRQVKDAACEDTLLAARRDNSFGAVSRGARQLLQISMLCVGAWLALSQGISAGGIVASSIIMSRALAPVDQIVGGWRTLVQAHSAWNNLMSRLGNIEVTPKYTPLPRPNSKLEIDALAVTTPGRETPLVRPFSFTTNGGALVGIVGPNGSGKTTLLQTLSGAWPVAAGTVSLGGRELHAWPSEDRGRYIGYMPQTVELVPGTVAENIARFTDEDLSDTYAAAERAGAHDVILGLPNGYDTQIGPGGIHLSAGQSQLIGLARALYHNPTLLLLDEPMANLDLRAQERIVGTLKEQAQRGAVIVITTHAPDFIKSLDLILTIERGSITASQPRRSPRSVELTRKPRIAEAEI